MQGEPQTFERVLGGLKGRFSNGIVDVGTRADMLSVIKLKPDVLLEAARYLRDEGTFSHCALVFAVDWIDRYEVVYDLWSDDLSGYVELSVDIGAEDPHVDSVANLWYGANWHEREAWDMLGVRFDGHPDLRRVLMPEGYRFHPLRKSFELHEPEELEVKAKHV